MKQFNRAFFRDLWRLSHPYWTSSEERWVARGLLALIIFLNLVMVDMNYRITNWYNSFYDDMQKYKVSAVWHGVITFLILATIFIIAAVYQTYFQQMLYIKWRKWLTDRYLHNWLGRTTYYHMQILGDGTDNPDQRIAEDLDLFTNQTLGFIIGIIGALTTLVAFMALLWNVSATAAIPWHGGKLILPGYLVWTALVYSAIGTYVIAIVGRPLIQLNFNQQRFQADFRYSLVRLRENSDSVALYRGEDRENQNFVSRFFSLFGNFWQIMKRTRRLNWWSSGYGQLAIIFPLVVTLPGYLAKFYLLGTLVQVSSAFGQIQGAFSFFANNYGSLAGWHAVVDRLRYFEQSMDKIRDVQETNFNIIRHEGERLRVRNVDVDLPDNHALLKAVNFELSPGERMLVVGRSGSGKSTFIRLLAGIWPFGDGEIDMPPTENVFFLPQKPYLPLGSLRDLLLYPHGKDTTTDSELKIVLAASGLPNLMTHLDEVYTWPQILSIGEQQRLAFARIFLQRPQWIFMDEATSAVDEAGEGELYSTLVEQLPGSAVVSVGHRSTLEAYHDQRFVLYGDGTWRTETITHG